MIVIGERINGMFGDVKNAIKERNPEVIRDLACRQEECGASMLDINVGPIAKNEKADAMKWLIEAAQEASKLTICIDTPSFEVMQSSIAAAKNPVVINSSPADPEKLEKYIGLAKEYNAGLILLTMDKSGIPSDVDGRVALGAQGMSQWIEAGLAPEDLYVDPIILPVNCNQQQPLQVMETIRQLKEFSPTSHFNLGLSNLSQGTDKRSLLSRIYLAMCMPAGLDTAIMDPMDKELMDAMITCEMLMNKQIYCDSFLEAYYNK